jgi:hypothetical protein
MCPRRRSWTQVGSVGGTSGGRKILGEDEEWLREISNNMDPEEGCLWVIGVGEDGWGFGDITIDVTMVVTIQPHGTEGSTTLRVAGTALDM